MNLTNINEIKELLSRHGFRFSKSMGQNFLTQSWVPEEIAASAEISSDMGALEVGPGIGCLTEQLSCYAKKVVSIELDTALKPVLRETLRDRDNVEIVFGDALKLDLGELCAKKLPDMKRAVCANLPYNVTSPLITAFLQCGQFESVTVMIQKEVAQRICARPGTADYGAFTVLVNWYAEPELLFTVPPSCFIPQPKVTSAVVRMKLRQAPPVEVSDEELFFRIVRAAFGMRRKTLVNALSANFSQISKEKIENIITNCGFDPLTRGEVLSIGEFATITGAFAEFLC